MEREVYKETSLSYHSLTYVTGYIPRIRMTSAPGKILAKPIAL